MIGRLRLPLRLREPLPLGTVLSKSEMVWPGWKRTTSFVCAFRIHQERESIIEVFKRGNWSFKVLVNYYCSDFLFLQTILCDEQFVVVFRELEMNPGRDVPLQVEKMRRPV